MKKRLLALILATFMLAFSVQSAIIAIADEITPATPSPTSAPTAEPSAAPAYADDAAEISSDVITALSPNAAPAEDTTAAPVQTQTPEPDFATITPAATTAAPAQLQTIEPTSPLKTEQAAQTVVPVQLQVVLTGDQRYARVGEIPIELTLTISGGTADYCVTWEVAKADEVISVETVYLTREGDFAYSYMPTVGGENTVRAVVVDGAGQTSDAAVTLPVSAYDDSIARWEKKTDEVEFTGDWREDLLAVAKTQIGYRESYIDFRIDEDGDVQGATLYGQWYRSPYGEWCAMFVSWCLYQSGVDEADFPYAANCLKWKKALEKLDAYEEAGGEYEPVPGDLVFFRNDDDDTPRHVGIVETVEDDVLHTIEGNSCKRVEQKEYERDDPHIVGYVCTETLMLRADVLPTAEPSAEPTVEPTPEPSAEPTVEPTPEQSAEPTVEPTVEPTPEQSAEQTVEPMPEQSAEPTVQPTDNAETNAGSADEAQEIPVTGVVKAKAVLTDTDSRLLVRSRPGMDGEKVEALRHNEIVSVLAVNGEWLKVVTKEDVTGYVAASRMQIIEGELPTSAATPEPAYPETDAPETDVSESTAPDMPADTAPVYFCGLDEHTHGEACGDDCTITEHVHDESCMIEPEWLCGYTAHTHGSECFDSEGALTCDLPLHEHSAECLIERTETMRYCGLDEHVHGSDCFGENGELICTIPEHQHSEKCEIETVLRCGLEEHAHSDACFDASGSLVCTMQEHVHDESCTVAHFDITLSAENVKLRPGEAFYPVNISAQLSGAVLPVEATFTVEMIHEAAANPVAANEETETVFDETVEGYAGEISIGDSFTMNVETDAASVAFMPTAYGVYRVTVSAIDAGGVSAEASAAVTVSLNETESAADWETTISGASLLGDLRLDVPAVARTQLGYAESAADFMIDADGEIHGYTRYGEWYGVPYGDWCAMFAAFCLEYAGSTDIPYSAGCAEWVELLAAEGAYHTADAYFPLPGDLIFFDNDGDGLADHVGIVEENAYDLNAVEFSVTAIEGNVGGMVVRRVYAMPGDASVLGYGQIDENEMQTGIDAVVAVIDALPTPEEAVEYLSVLEEAEDYEAMEEYYIQYGSQAYDAYLDYQLLDICLQEFVYNYEKLANLEWLWSYALLLSEIESDTPTTVSSVSTSEFVDMNLYDYSGNINEKYRGDSKYPGFQWNGGAYLNNEYRRNTIDYIDFGNSKITDFDYVTPSQTNGKSASAQNITRQGGAINDIDVGSYGVTNRPIGVSTGDAVLQSTLGSDGYPALADGTSLKYLFDGGTYAKKQNTSSIDGLFRQDATTGEYYYNSRWNHAQYSNNRFTLYNQIITPNFITYPFGNFLPLNDITNGANATQVSKITSVGTYVSGIIADLSENPGATENQLIYMLGLYRNALQGVSTTGGNAWQTWSAMDAINDYFTTSSGDHPSDNTSLITTDLLNRMYNIDWDVDTNFFFGMSMSMNFVQPKGGKTGNDTNGDGKPDYDMRFYFTGDDDVWVYIDGVLFMDLSGIHRHVGGEIDFVNGKVYYYSLNTSGTGDVSSEPYKTYTFEEILSSAGRDTSGLNSKGTFADYTVHDFKFYYMERGSGSSVCRINFNFPMLKQNSISVSKELTSDVETICNPDFKFQVLKAKENETGTELTEELFIGAGVEYAIYDQNDTKIGTGRTDANGVFTLKAGQRAEFDGISEDSGTYYVRELLEGTVLEQYDQITVSGNSTTVSANVIVGNAAFTGVNSPVMDASDGSTMFRFDNGVNESKLGILTLSKTVTGYLDGETTDTDRDFTFRVALDGAPLPAGTKYTVAGTTMTVAADGVITLKAGQTAVISNILAGTAYEITETGHNDYDPGWIVVNSEDGREVLVDGTVVTGEVKVGVDARFRCVNAERGTDVNIPVVKRITHPDGLAHEFSFSIVEVTADGEVIGETMGKTIALDANQSSSEDAELFSLHYPATSLKVGENVFYYRITEIATEGVDCDKSVYIVKVTVTKTAEGECSAEKSITKDGAAVDKVEFTNVLLSDVSISKTVQGGGDTAKETEFSFTISLSNGGTPVSGTFDTTVLTQDGASGENGRLVFDSTGSAAFKLGHGQKLTIKGVPVGTTWNVTETDYNGFTPYVGEIQTDTTGSLIVGAAGNEAAFVNKTTFRLPETGGTGTSVYACVGALLLAAAGLALYNNRKRDRRGGQI